MPVREQSLRILALFLVYLFLIPPALAQEEKGVLTEEERLEKAREIAASKLMKLSASLKPHHLAQMFEAPNHPWARRSLARAKDELIRFMKAGKKGKPAPRIASERKKLEKRRKRKMKELQERIDELTLTVADRGLTGSRKRIVDMLSDLDFIKNFERVHPREQGWLVSCLGYRKRGGQAVYLIDPPSDMSHKDVQLNWTSSLEPRMASAPKKEQAYEVSLRIGVETEPMLLILPGPKELSPAGVQSTRVIKFKLAKADPWASFDNVMADDTLRRRSAAGRRGADGKSNAAIDKGQAWLALHQSANGSWDMDEFFRNGDPKSGPLCDGKGEAIYDVGGTALALLAMMSQGDTHATGDFSSSIKRGLQFLIASQDPEGFIGFKTVDRPAWIQALGTLALVEAYRLTGSVALRGPAQQAVNMCLAMQNPYKAWRYHSQPGDNSTTVTSWMVAALHRAELARLKVRSHTFGWAQGFIDEMTDDEVGRVGYNKRGELSVRLQGKHEEFPSQETESCTAMGVVAGAMCRDPESIPTALMRLADENLISKKLPLWDLSRGSIDMYYWYWGTLANGVTGSKSASKWEKALLAAVVGTQRQDGNFSGSWDPVGAWGEPGGRVYATAIQTMTLAARFATWLPLPAGR